MSTSAYSALLVAVMSAVTILLRAAPFLIFKRKAPAYVLYLGQVLPAAIIGMLVVYCLKDTNLLSAPFGVPETGIAAFVREKRPWIDKTRQHMAESPMAQAERATPDQVKLWRAVVQDCVPALVAEWEPILGVKAGKLAYRNMRSRWGSCQPSTGRICINVRLALYPPECLEYVVVHELCHLLVHGHGPEFQSLMTRVMPDWRKRRAKLK